MYNMRACHMLTHVTPRGWVTHTHTHTHTLPWQEGPPGLTESVSSSGAPASLQTPAHQGYQAARGKEFEV